MNGVTPSSIDPVIGFAHTAFAEQMIMYTIELTAGLAWDAPVAEVHCVERALHSLTSSGWRKRC